MDVGICHSINLQPSGYVFTTLLCLHKTLRTHSKTEIPTKSLHTMAGHPVISCRGWLIEIQQTDRSAQRVTNSVSSTYRNPRKN